jgi:hypothetical protein
MIRHESKGGMFGIFLLVPNGDLYHTFSVSKDTKRTWQKEPFDAEKALTLLSKEGK